MRTVDLGNSIGKFGPEKGMPTLGLPTSARGKYSGARYARFHARNTRNETGISGFVVNAANHGFPVLDFERFG